MNEHMINIYTNILEDKYIVKSKVWSDGKVLLITERCSDKNIEEIRNAYILGFDKIRLWPVDNKECIDYLFSIDV